MMKETEKNNMILKDNNLYSNTQLNLITIHLPASNFVKDYINCKVHKNVGKLLDFLLP